MQLYPNYTQKHVQIPGFDAFTVDLTYKICFTLIYTHVAKSKILSSVHS